MIKFYLGVFMTGFAFTSGLISGFYLTQMIFGG